MRLDKQIFNLWLACWTQEEIAEEFGVDQKTIANVLGESAELPELLKPRLARPVSLPPSL